MDGNKKVGADGGHFSEVPSLREEISIILTSNSSRRQSYESTSKIEPVAINIYRNITKCLACYGLFKKFLIDSKFKRISF